MDGFYCKENMTNITFVDDDDNVIGSGAKQDAWEKGIYHRIVRIFLFNPKGELLIQKRSGSLTSLPGRWDQSAGGHVDEGETYQEAARREMEEEIGVTNIALRKVLKTKTNEIDEPDKMKRRFNMLYTAYFAGDVKLNEEVSETRWISPSELLSWMSEKPDDFPEGFRLTFKELTEHERVS